MSVSKTLFAVFFHLVLIIAANAQNHGIGLTANALTTITNATPLQMGFGNQLGVWYSLPLGNKSGLEFQVSHRYNGSYNLREITVIERELPQEYQQTMHTRQLESMSFIDLWICLKRKLGANSRWSLSGGFFLAYMYAVDAGSYDTGWGIYAGVSHTPTFVIGGAQLQVPPTNTSVISVREFNRLDLGITSALSFRICPGLEVKGAVLQGTTNLLGKAPFQQLDSHYLTSFSLGFSAQIL